MHQSRSVAVVSSMNLSYFVVMSAGAKVLTLVVCQPGSQKAENQPNGQSENTAACSS